MTTNSTRVDSVLNTRNIRKQDTLKHETHKTYHNRGHITTCDTLRHGTNQTRDTSQQGTHQKIVNIKKQDTLKHRAHFNISQHHRTHHNMEHIKNTGHLTTWDPSQHRTSKRMHDNTEHIKTQDTSQHRTSFNKGHIKTGHIRTWDTLRQVTHENMEHMKTQETQQDTVNIILANVLIDSQLIRVHSLLEERNYKSQNHPIKGLQTVLPGRSWRGELVGQIQTI